MPIYPLKVQPIQSAGECQFYARNTNNESVCYVKPLVDIKSALGVMEREGKDFDPLMWSSDCGGNLDQCAFIPILFESNQEPVGPVGPTAEDIESYLEESDAVTVNVANPSTAAVGPKPFEGKTMTRASRVIAEFDPFASDEKADAETEAQAEDLTPVAHTNAVSVLNDVKAHEESTNGTQDAIPAATAVNSEVQFKIVGPDTFKKPYQIWQTSADLMIIPANTVLSLPDRWLHKMSRGNIQLELDRILKARKVSIGQLLQTTNGGDYPDGVKAQKMMHAVIAAETWVSNVHTITQVTPKCLFAADAMGAKTVVLTPFDCGTVDIDTSARAQLTAIRKFLYSNKIDSVKRLYIVMSDRLSYEVFMCAYGEIFYGVVNNSEKSSAIIA